MNTTALHITHLLFGHGNLVVPGLGTFVTVYKAAHYDATRQKFLPPVVYKILDPSLTIDDDTLVRSLMRRENMTEFAARRRMEIDISEIKRELEQTGCYSLGNCGELLFNSNNSNISYSDSARRTTSDAFSWLQELSAETISLTEEKPESTVEEQRNNSMLRTASRAASYAATFALFTLLAFIFSNIRHTESRSQMASIGIEQPSLPVLALTENITDRNYAPESSLVLILNTPADGISDPEPKTPKRLQQTHRYFYIVASLANRSEAEKFISSNKSGLPLGILESDGRYRVYAASGETTGATLNAAKENGAKDNFGGGWICRH